MSYTGKVKIYRSWFRNLIQSKWVSRKGIPELIEYLEREGFFLEPASKHNHNAFPGGLAKHSLDVHQLFGDKVAYYKLDVPIDSIIVASLFHDLCKLNIYKQDENGELITDDPFPCGHGEKSIIMLQRFIKLKDQEIMLIRWHMGYFEGGLSESYSRKAWRQAMKKYPEIVAFHCADWEAATYFQGEKK